MVATMYLAGSGLLFFSIIRWRPGFRGPLSMGACFLLAFGAVDTVIAGRPQWEQGQHRAFYALHAALMVVFLAASAVAAFDYLFRDLGIVKQTPVLRLQTTLARLVFYVDLPLCAVATAAALYFGLSEDGASQWLLGWSILSGSCFAWFAHFWEAWWNPNMGLGGGEQLAGKEASSRLEENRRRLKRIIGR